MIDIIVFVLGAIIVWPLAVWAGRKFQHFTWEWHLPYEQRLRRLKKR
jgi:hypothetical protein